MLRIRYNEWLGQWEVLEDNEVIETGSKDEMLELYNEMATNKRESIFK